MAQPEIVEGLSKMEPQLVNKAVETFSPYGPWALLAVLLLLATGTFGWFIYQRMANALDRMHNETVKMATDHATEMKGVMEKYQTAIGVITDKHTSVCTGFMEHLGELSNGVQKLGDRVENLENKIKG